MKDNGIMNRQKALSLKESSEYLGCSPAFLHGVCKSRSITHTRIGNRIRISMLDLDLYRAEHTIERQTPASGATVAGNEGAKL